MKYLILFMLISSILVNPAYGASAGDDDTPPTGGGGGGGGSPEYYDYYVPLVFGETHPDGLSEVSVWFIQGSELITSFALNDLGQQSMTIREPAKLIFNPIDNFGLTNGSLIRTTVPVLVTGHRSTEDIFSDKSFAYSILIDRMMGFEYTSPVNGWVNLLTLTPQTEVMIEGKNGDSVTHIINEGLTTGSFKVNIGDKINSSYPTNGAFISYEGGTYASMTVPKYLRGNEYIFDLNSRNPKIEEIEQSYLQIIPTEPTHLTLIYEFGLNREMDIFDITRFDNPSTLRSIRSSRGEITVTLHQQTAYGGLTRRSMVQFIAAPEMRSGELFITPSGYSSHLAVLKDDTKYITLSYDPDIHDYTLTSKLELTKHQFEIISYVGLTDSTLVWGNEASFGYLSSPGLVGHPMSPSLAFLNLPLNLSTNRANVSDLLSTWYRFPNLALQKIEVLPGPAEQYTGQTIRVEFDSNGTLPSSRFRVQVTIDGEIVTDEVHNFLGVNESLIYKYSKFINFGAKTLNITARIDIENDVNEINESDNSSELNVEVQENFRLKWSIIGITLLILVYTLIRIRKRIKRNSDLKRSHVDAIISIEVREDNT